MPTRRDLFALAAAVATTFATTLAAPAFGAGALVDVQVLDRSRNELLATYRHRGAEWVAGSPGSRYAVRLRNRSAARVLVVLSVDGVNAVTGETAATLQSGYVLEPYQSTDITGWRKSQAEAAAFYFTALADSYAAKTDRPDNVGVIGAAVFRERVRALPEVDRDLGLSSKLLRRGEAAPADRPDNASNSRAAEPAAPAAAPEARAAEQARAAADAVAESAGRMREERVERLGTGHGEREYAPTQWTRFDRAGDQPAEVVRIRYDSYANLLAGGIIRRERVTPSPDPFPGFVPDPRS